MDMWFLVTRVDEIEGELAVQREVSLAAPIEQDSPITSWRERLVLAPQRFREPVVFSEEPEPPDEIDVYVDVR